MRKKEKHPSERLMRDELLQCVFGKKFYENFCDCKAAAQTCCFELTNEEYGMVANVSISYEVTFHKI